MALGRVYLCWRPANDNIHLFAMLRQGNISLSLIQIAFVVSTLLHLKSFATEIDSLVRCCCVG